MHLIQPKNSFNGSNNDLRAHNSPNHLRLLHKKRFYKLWSRNAFSPLLFHHVWLLHGSTWTRKHNDHNLLLHWGLYLWNLYCNWYLNDCRREETWDFVGWVYFRSCYALCWYCRVVFVSFVASRCCWLVILNFFLL